MAHDMARGCTLVALMVVKLCYNRICSHLQAGAVSTPPTESSPVSVQPDENRLASRAGLVDAKERISPSLRLLRGLRPRSDAAATPGSRTAPARSGRSPS